MAGNVIHRGPLNRVPNTINRVLSGAYLPGTLVEDTGSALTQLTTAVDKVPMVLSNMQFKDQDIATAYASGDTGVAYEALPGDRFQCRMAAATYAARAPLTVAASGRLAAAASGNPIVAFFDDTPGAYSAGDLADVIWANSSAKA